MTDFYTAGAVPADHASGESATIRAEYAAIETGFGKVAGYTGNANKVVVINSAGTAQTTATVSESFIIPCTGETQTITAGTGKFTFRMPYAFTLTAVRASLQTAQTSGSILTVDINDGGTTILSTKLTIDNGEKTSTTAAAAAVISDTALADDAEITIDVDQVGDGTAKGLKVELIGRQW